MKPTTDELIKEFREHDCRTYKHSSGRTRKMSFNKTFFLIIGAFGGFIATTFDGVWREAFSDYTIGSFPLGSILFICIVLGIFYYELNIGERNKK